MSIWLRRANDEEPNPETGGSDSDIINLKRNVALETDAIQIYRGQLENARPHVRKLLEHIIQEEINHIKEFELQLKNIDKELSEEELESHAE